MRGLSTIFTTTAALSLFTAAYMISGFELQVKVAIIPAVTLTPGVAALASMALGLGGMLALASAAQVVDDTFGKSDYDSKMSCGKAIKTVGLALLALVDEVTDILSCITFYKNEAMPFFWTSIGLFVLSTGVNFFSALYAGRCNPALIVTGVLGLGPIHGAVISLIDGEESDGAAYMKLFEAIGESATQFTLQLYYLTVTTWRAAWRTSPVIVVSAGISFFTLAAQFAMYPNSQGGRTGYFTFPMQDECRGRKDVTVALFFYFASDLGLRALAICVFGYAATAASSILCGSLYVGINAIMVFIVHDTRFWFGCFGGSFHAEQMGWLHIVVGPITGIFPFLKLADANVKSLHAKLEFLLSTTATVAAVYVGLFCKEPAGLWPGLETPHKDPAFIRNVYSMASAAFGCKLAAFVWYLYPSTFGYGDASRYDSLLDA